MQNNSDYIQVKSLWFKPYIREVEIAKAVQRIARQLDEAHSEEVPVCLIVLNGAFMFGSDLIKAMTIECEVHFVRLSSYSGTSSTGVVRETQPLEVDVSGRNVILIEDIIDTGNTMHYYLPRMKAKGVKELSLVTLLLKEEALQHPLKVDHVGFKIPNDFVVGYGLDYDQQGRQLTDIYTLVPEEEEVKTVH
jgi:hypoxanthine phosphoribosyltransferase